MAENLSISVVIPTYQRRDTITAAVASVLNQDLPPCEVIVVDDGSTDRTAGALREMFGTAVTVIERENGGPGAARNTGIAAARGEVVAFIDSDNHWLPHHLAVVRGMFDAHPESVLVSTQRNYSFGTEQVADARCADIAADLFSLLTSIGLTTGMAVRRQALLDVGGFEESMRYGEDIDLALRLALLGPVTRMRGRTFVRAERRADSLGTQARSSGESHQMLTLTGQRLLAVLAESDRADVDTLLAAAKARVEIGMAYDELASRSQLAEIRAHLAEARRLVPALADEPRYIAYTLPWHVRGWDSRRRQRLQIVTRLLLAWPKRPLVGTARLWLAETHVVAMRSD